MNLGCMMIRRRTLLLLSLSWCILGLQSNVSRADTKSVNFSRDIRPILSDKCFQCHGPDAAKQESGLRLDLREDAIEPADSGAIAIKPHDLAASELIKRITATDESLQMPPKSSNKSLSEQEVELLKQWIAEGAKYEGIGRSLRRCDQAYRLSSRPRMKVGKAIPSIAFYSASCFRRT